MNVQLTNLQQLRDAIMLTQTRIPQEGFLHLVKSIPGRIQAVLGAKWRPYSVEQPLSVYTAPSTIIGTPGKDE